jgi:uncharacterized repeat protein (TIGR03803 family)
VVTTLYSFTGGDDGGDPLSTLVQGRDGSFYGTTYNGSTNDDGTVFKITTNGVLTTLCEFGAFTNVIPAGDFSEPFNGLVQGSDDNFYGVIYAGGVSDFNYDAGTVYEITTNGVLTVLHSFGVLIDGNFLDGIGPYGPLVQGSDGSFYGTTEGGGTNGAGTVFRLTIVPEAPQLTITPLGADVILTWPTDATGFTLQSTTNLGSPDWITVSGQFAVTNPISGTQMFFRLIQ